MARFSKSSLGKARRASPLVKLEELRVDWGKLTRVDAGIDALLGVAPPHREQAAIEAMADPAVRRILADLASDSLCNLEDPIDEAAIHPLVAQVLFESSSDKPSKAHVFELFEKLRPVAKRLQLRSIQTKQDVTTEAAEAMRPLQFSVGGTSSILAAASAVEELVLVVVSGVIEVEIEGVRHGQAVRGGMGLTCIMIAGDDGLPLPDVRLRSVSAEACGMVVPYSSLPWRVEGERIVASGRAAHAVSGRTRVETAEIPLGKDLGAAIKKMTKVPQDVYVHAEADRAGHVSPYVLAPEAPTRHLEVRLVLARGDRQDGDLYCARHVNDQEIVMPLTGSVLVQTAPGSWRNDILDLNRAKLTELDPTYVPRTILAQSGASAGGDLEPVVVLLDSGEFHGVRSATVDDAICLHILQLKELGKRSKVAVARSSKSLPPRVRRSGRA